MNHSIAAVVVLVALLSACSTTGSPTASLAERAFAGSSRPVSTAIVEAMAGGLIAGTPGVQLDSRERRRVVEAEVKSLPGRRTGWGRRIAASTRIQFMLAPRCVRPAALHVAIPTAAGRFSRSEIAKKPH